MAQAIDATSLPLSGDTTRVFHGAQHDAPVSFFLVDLAPGEGPDLHRHPYQEVFVVQEGKARFVVGDETLDAEAGNIVVAPADTAHAFTNSGRARLRTVNIHPVSEMVTEWLET